MSRHWDSDAYEATVARDPQRKPAWRKRIPYEAGMNTYWFPAMCPYVINRDTFGLVPGKLDGAYVRLFGSGHTQDEPMKRAGTIPSFWEDDVVWLILMVDTKNIIGWYEPTNGQLGGQLDDSVHKVVIGYLPLGKYYDAMFEPSIIPYKGRKPVQPISATSGGAPSILPPDEEGTEEPSVWWYKTGNLAYVEFQHESGDPDLDPMEFKYVRYDLNHNHPNLPF